MQKRKSLLPLDNYFKTKNDHLEFNGHNVKNTLILPFSTKMEKAVVKRVHADFRSFNGVVGEVYRYSLNKELPQDLKKSSNKDDNKTEEFKIKLKQSIITKAKENTKLVELDDIELARKLESIIDSLYFKGNDLNKYGYHAMPFLYWNDKHVGLKNIAEYFVSLFINQDVVELFHESTEGKEHLFHILINESLPELMELKNNRKLNEYLVLDYNIINQFQEDLKLISKDSKQFLRQINHLLKYYYYWYVSAVGTKLNQFFEEDQVEGYYFTLDSEVFSKNRKANQRGWKQLESKLKNLFSHSVCIDLLNHSTFCKESSDYIQIRNIYDGLDEISQKILLEDVKYIRQQYMEIITTTDKKWDDFERELLQKNRYRHTEHELEKEILHLWYAIDFQFHYSGRKSRYRDYSKWFIEYCKANYLKNRGRGGSCLTLDSENLLFLTDLAVGDQDKIRLKELWIEFQKRGILLDDGTKSAVIEFFEKINLIEKKSDSGDAQYVKKIL